MGAFAKRSRDAEAAGSSPPRPGARRAPGGAGGLARTSVPSPGRRRQTQGRKRGWASGLVAVLAWPPLGACVHLGASCPRPGSACRWPGRGPGPALHRAGGRTGGEDPPLKGQLRRLLTEPGGGGALRPLNESCRGHFTTRCWTPNPGGSRNTFQSRKRASSETGPVKRGEGPPQGRPALSRLRWGRAGRPGPAPHSLHAAGLRRAGRRGGPGAASPALPCCFWGLQRGPGLAPLGPLGPRQGHQPRQLL